MRRDMTMMVWRVKKRKTPLMTYASKKSTACHAANRAIHWRADAAEVNWSPDAFWFLDVPR